MSRARVTLKYNLQSGFTVSAIYEREMKVTVYCFKKKVVYDLRRTIIAF